MNNAELQQRTKAFALAVIRLIGALPRSPQAGVIGRQLLRAATSVGANYRAACRARSRAEFVSRIAVVEEEADESLYWLELLSESRIVNGDRLDDLMKEANELTAIFVASGRTAKRHPEIRNPHSEIRNDSQGLQTAGGGGFSYCAGESALGARERGPLWPHS